MSTIEDDQIPAIIQEPTYETILINCSLCLENSEISLLEVNPNKDKLLIPEKNILNGFSYFAIFHVVDASTSHWLALKYKVDTGKFVSVCKEEIHPLIEDYLSWNGRVSPLNLKKFFQQYQENSRQHSRLKKENFDLNIELESLKTDFEKKKLEEIIKIDDTVPELKEALYSAQNDLNTKEKTILNQKKQIKTLNISYQKLKEKSHTLEIEFLIKQNRQEELLKVKDNKIDNLSNKLSDLKENKENAKKLSANEIKLGEELEKTRKDLTEKIHRLIEKDTKILHFENEIPSLNKLSLNFDNVYKYLSSSNLEEAQKNLIMTILIKNDTELKISSQTLQETDSNADVHNLKTQRRLNGHFIQLQKYLRSTDMFTQLKFITTTENFRNVPKIIYHEIQEYFEAMLNTINDNSKIFLNSESFDLLLSDNQNAVNELTENLTIKQRNSGWILRGYLHYFKYDIKPLFNLVNNIIHYFNSTSTIIASLNNNLTSEFKSKDIKREIYRYIKNTDTKLFNYLLIKYNNLFTELIEEDHTFFHFTGRWLKSKSNFYYLWILFICNNEWKSKEEISDVFGPKIIPNNINLHDTMNKLVENKYLQKKSNTFKTNLEIWNNLENNNDIETMIKGILVL